MRSTAMALGLGVLLLGAPGRAWGEFRAGAAAVDVTPRQLPVLVNGGMLSRTANQVKAPLTARAIVLHDAPAAAG